MAMRVFGTRDMAQPTDMSHLSGQQILHQSFAGKHLKFGCEREEAFHLCSSCGDFSKLSTATGPGNGHGQVIIISIRREGAAAATAASHPTSRDTNCHP